jgi:hypothetical protein
MAGIKKPPPLYVPTPPPIQDAPDLREYSREHVAYEVQVFFGAILAKRADIATAGGPKVAHAIDMALLEAIAVHARNLIEFCYPDAFRRGSRNTDVVAHHYLDSFDAWSKVRPPLTEALRLAKTRADTEVAHLTIERIPGGPPHKTWQFVNLGDDLRTVLRAFVEAADPARLHARVSREIPDGEL